MNTKKVKEYFSDFRKKYSTTYGPVAEFLLREDADGLGPSFNDLLEALGEGGELVAALKDRLARLGEMLENDPAGMASTMLHRTRTALEERSGAVEFLCEVGAITMDDAGELRDQVRELQNKIKELLQARIKWHAARIDETIEARKTNGTYKGEFTTAVILANAYNDIFYTSDFEG
jgi:hypothetical protein